MQKNIINSIKKFILILSVLLVSVSAFAVPKGIGPVTVTPTLPTPTFSVSAGNYGTEELASDISQAASLTEGDVIGALRSFSDIIKTKLIMGYNVKLNGIGTFSISLTSEACDTEKECKPNKVRAGKISFKADNVLRKELDELKFYKTITHKNRKKR